MERIQWDLLHYLRTIVLRQRVNLQIAVAVHDSDKLSVAILLIFLSSEEWSFLFQLLVNIKHFFLAVKLRNPHNMTVNAHASFEPVHNRHVNVQKYNLVVVYWLWANYLNCLKPVLCYVDVEFWWQLIKVCHSDKFIVIYKKHWKFTITYHPCQWVLTFSELVIFDAFA